ncbi:hypothetical protein ABK040_008399 [Willaertia magna]
MKRKKSKLSPELISICQTLSDKTPSKTGFLLKQGLKWKSWKKRFIEIYDDILIYRNSDEPNSQIIGALILNNGSVQIDEKQKRTFYVKCEKSYSSDNVYNERVYIFQTLESDNEEEERESWIKSLKRSFTEKARARMRTRTRLQPIVFNQETSPRSSECSSDNNVTSSSNLDSPNSPRITRKLAAVVVTNATTTLGMEIVKSLLLRKIHVIAISYEKNQNENNNNSGNNTRKSSFGSSNSKDELLRSYGSTVININEGIIKFEKYNLAQTIQNMKSLKVTVLIHIPQHIPEMIGEFNEVINFSLQLGINRFFFCSKYFIFDNKNNNEEKRNELTLYNYYLQCENLLKSYYGESSIIFRINGSMQDFLLFYDERTRTFYFPFGSLQNFEDSDVKQVSWVDYRDVGMSISTMVMNYLFQSSCSIRSNSVHRSRRFTNMTTTALNNSINNNVDNNSKSIVSKSIYHLSGIESLTIDDVIQKFSRKTNVPVEYKIVERDVSIRRLIDSKGLSEWECNCLHDIYAHVYDNGLSKEVVHDLESIKGSPPTTFDSFIEREIETFQDHNPCICMIGSIHFVQSKLLHAIHDRNYRSKNIIFNQKEIPDYPFKTAQYITFEYDKEKSAIESQYKEKVEEIRKGRKSEDNSLIYVPKNIKKSSSTSSSDLSSLVSQEDSVEIQVKTQLSEKFLDIVGNGISTSEKLIIFIRAKYILNKWIDLEIIQKIIELAHRSTKMKHIMLLYDSATGKICEDFIIKLSLFLSRKCKITYTFIEFGWLYQTFAVLCSELQTSDTLSIPASKIRDSWHTTLNWCDGDDVIYLILHLMQTINTDSVQLINKFIISGESMSFKQIVELLSNILGKRMSCIETDVSKAFPCIYSNQNDILTHRSLKKEMIYYLNFSEERQLVEYPHDVLDFESATGTKFKTFKEFIEQNTLLFADIIEVSRCPFPIFVELEQNSNNIEEQEKIIFKHLSERAKDPNSTLTHVIKQYAKQFMETYSQTEKQLSVEEKILEVTRIKSLILSFFEKMNKVLSSQVQLNIINIAFNNKVNVRVKLTDLTPYFQQVVETVLFKDIFPIILEPYKKDFQAKNSVLNSKYLELSYTTPRHLEVGDEYCLDGNGKSSEENYKEAIDTFKQILSVNHLVDGKIPILTNTSKAIVKCVSDYHGKGMDVSADSLLPIFIFVIIKAAIPDLYCHFKIIEDFVHESFMTGVGGYSLVTLSIAIDYLSSLSWEQLERNFLLQQQLKKQQDEYQEKQLQDTQQKRKRGMSTMLNRPNDSAVPVNIPTLGIANRDLDEENEDSSKETDTGSSLDEDNFLSISEDIEDDSATVPATPRTYFSTKGNELSAHDSAELSVLLLKKILQIYNQSITLTEERFAWGKQLQLSKELIHLNSLESFNEFKELCYRLDGVSLVDLKKSKHLLIVFLINIYHVMLLHGFIKNGSYPLLSTLERTQFLKNPMYEINGVLFSLDDIECLLTSVRKIEDSDKHLLLRDFYFRDPLHIFAIGHCCSSSPPIRIYYPTSHELVRAQLKQQACSYLLNSCSFDLNSRQLSLSSLIQEHLELFGDVKEAVINWIINHLPKDNELRDELSLVLTYALVQTRYIPFNYDFKFNVLISDV